MLNGANLDAHGVKPSVQLPIEAGYRVASFFGRRSGRARRNAEMLGLMVNDPNIAPEELAALSMPTLVVAGTRDMIKEEHTRVYSEQHPGCKARLRGGGSLRGEEEPGGVQRGGRGVSAGQMKPAMKLRFHAQCMLIAILLFAANEE